MTILKTLVTFATLLVFVSTSRGQYSEADYSEPEQSEEQGVTLPEYIGSIAEKESISANDFFFMANGTLQVAQALSQQGGQALPEPVVLDALDAVSAGRQLSPDAADWDNVEARLKRLLEPPPEQQQQQQGQDGENSEQQEQQESGSEGEQSSSEDSQSGQQQQEEQGEGQNSEQSDSQSQEGSQSQQSEDESSQNQGEGAGEQDSGGEEGELAQARDGAQMGDLQQDQEPQDIQLADGEEQSTQTPPEEMQTLGGQQATGEPIDVENAAIRQMLEQLRQQDDPGKLFKILQDAQSGEKQNSQPNTKDW